MNNVADKPLLLNQPQVMIIDYDRNSTNQLSDIAAASGARVNSFQSIPEFINWLEYDRLPTLSCVLVEMNLPEMTGVDLLNVLAADNVVLPTILMTVQPTVSMAVTGILSGAVNFIEKPLQQDQLVSAINEALQHCKEISIDPEVEGIKARFDSLTPRQKQVFNYVFRGKLNKTIADHLGISVKTVELHRAQMMERMHASSIAELVRMATLLNDLPAEVH